MWSPPFPFSFFVDAFYAICNIDFLWFHWRFYFCFFLFVFARLLDPLISVCSQYSAFGYFRGIFGSLFLMSGFLCFYLVLCSVCFPLLVWEGVYNFVFILGFFFFFLVFFFFFCFFFFFFFFKRVFLGPVWPGRLRFHCLLCHNGRVPIVFWGCLFVSKLCWFIAIRFAGVLF